MANTIKLKRGSGSDPGASDLSVGELAIRTDEGKIFTKKDDGSVAEISGGGGITDGDKGDITVSSSGATWTIDSGATQVANKLPLAGGTLTGSIDLGSNDVTSRYVYAKDIFLGDVSPELRFTDSDHNPDYYIRLNSGMLKIRDITNAEDRLVINADGHVDILGNLDVGAGIDVTGTATTGPLTASGTSNSSITASGTNSNITLTSSGTNSNINLYSTGSNAQVKLEANNGSSGFTYIDADTGVRLFHGGGFTNYKLRTTSTGVTVNGTCTATAFSGDGSGLTGVSGTTINNNADDRIITGSGTANTLEGESNVTWNGTDFKIGTSYDNTSRKLKFNNGKLEIYSNGDTTQGGSYIRTYDSGFFIGSESGQYLLTGLSTFRLAATSSNVKLYAGGAVKFQTSASGVTVTGTCTATTFSGTHSSGNIGLEIHGTGSGIGAQTKYHNDHGVNYIGVSGNTTGDMMIYNESNTATRFYTNSAERLTIAAGGAATFTGSVTATAFSGDGSSLTNISATDSTKLPLAGGTMTGDIAINNNVKVQWGDTSGGYLEIYNSGSDSIIKSVTDDLWIYAHDNIILAGATSGDKYLRTVDNGAIYLYYDNAVKAETYSAGFLLDGSILKFEDVASTPSASGNTHIYAHGGIIHTCGGSGIIFEEGGFTRWKIQNGALHPHGTTYNNLGNSTNRVGNAYIQTSVDLIDNAELRIGSSDDLKIYHDGNNSYIYDTGTGSLILRSSRVSFNDASNNEWGRFDSDGVRVVDSKKFRAGTDDDLQIYHSGSHSFIKDTGTGDLFICSDDLHIGNAANTEDMAVFTENAAVKLYYDNSEKLRTVTGGIQVYGQTASNNGFYLNNGSNIVLEDNGEAQFGNSADLKILHDGSHSMIKNATGYFQIWGDNSELVNAANNEYKARFLNNGAAQLFYDHALKFATTADGVNVSDESGAVQLRLYTGTSTLRGYLYADDSNRIYLLDAQGHAVIKGVKDSHLSLYYDNSQKFYTQSYGCVVAGHLKPESNNTYDLGDSNYRWANLYVNDMHFSNEGKSNSVDGTWGDWTLQEGDENIFMINNRTGKKYKMGLQEVN